MKRKVAIVLTLVYLFTATELSQLWKFPIFISHFIEHRQESPDITLFNFIADHYFGDDVRDSDYARDEQLPFRDHNQCLTGIFSSIVPPAANTVYQSNFLCQITFAPKTQDVKPSRYQTDIWQPPRV